MGYYWKKKYSWRDSVFNVFMKINIKTTNFHLTDHTRDYIFRKTDKLSRILQGVKLPQELYIEIGRTTRHHKKGDDLFRVEANLKLGNDILRIVSEEWDVMVAIDSARDGLARKIREFKGKRFALYKRRARIAKKTLRLSPEARFWRKGRIREEGI